ncbi:UPF0489 family protein [Clostridium sp.]|uniref:UPF0489 family protein n=1 Tax=Clostridium sp. TaxID=1506 RepID=UPI0029155316|nr:UPF0489 family protein [Clostridium sp.]MDU5107637.1 UPF0489 family protein [Clostridium sp.]
MRVLDIDLDFFQEGVAHFVSDYGDRLETGDTSAWEKERVVRYLEENLGLSKVNKIKGRIVEHHDEAFYFWRELISKNLLVAPFEVIHVDAHADLGFGDLSWKYIMTEYLYLSEEEKAYPENIDIDKFMKISCGNYLLYAISNGWIESLTYVIHPKWGQDLQAILFKNKDVNSGVIQLKKFNRGEKVDFWKFAEYKPVAYEKQVKFAGIFGEQYVNKEIVDFLDLSISPGYTMKETDFIIDIIKEYIEII